MQVLQLSPDVEAVIGATRPAAAHVHVGILRVGAREALRYARNEICDAGIGAVGIALDHRIAEINLPGANLIHVGKIVKMASLCADVCDLNQSATGDLVFDCEAPELGLRDI